MKDTISDVRTPLAGRPGLADEIKSFTVSLLSRWADLSFIVIHCRIWVGLCPRVGLSKDANVRYSMMMIVEYVVIEMIDIATFM